MLQIIPDFYNVPVINKLPKGIYCYRIIRPYSVIILKSKKFEKILTVCPENGAKYRRADNIGLRPGHYISAPLLSVLEVNRVLLIHPSI